MNDKTPGQPDDGFDSPDGRTYSAEREPAPDHYREAERLAAEARSYEGLPSNHHVQVGQLAQVHAVLALADAIREQTRALTTPVETPERDW